MLIYLLYSKFFRKREEITGVLIYCDFKTDESYTPSKIEILCGNDFNDLRSVKTKSFEEPRGWIEIPIKNSFNNPIHCWMLQVRYFYTLI